MSRIYKYPLDLTSGPQEVKMPANSWVCHVHAQDERPCLWAMVRVDQPAVTRTFFVVATGEEAPNATYLGTVHIGWTVWHIFDDNDEPF